MSENVIVNIIENIETGSLTSDDNEELNNQLSSMENIMNTAIEENIENNEENSDSMMAMQIEYNLNYTVKQLKAIAEYYKINTKRLKKDEIIENIILFEVDDENQGIVYTRKRLWYFVEELKNDSFFDNIIFPF